MAGCNCKGDKSKISELNQKPKGILGSKFMFVIVGLIIIPLMIPFVVFIALRQWITGKTFSTTNFINKYVKPSAKKVDDDIKEIDNPDDYELVGI